MSEPFFIAQTFEPDVIGDEEAYHAWVARCVKESSEKGGTWPRVTISEAGDGLLFECWKERPDDQGEPRWQMQEAN